MDIFQAHAYDFPYFISLKQNKYDSFKMKKKTLQLSHYTDTGAISTSRILFSPADYDFSVVIGINVAKHVFMVFFNLYGFAIEELKSS